MSMNKLKKLLLFGIASAFFAAVPLRAAEVIPPEKITESRYDYETEEARTGDFVIPVSFGRASFLKPETAVIYHGPDMVIQEMPVSRLDTVKEGDVLVRLVLNQDPLDTEEKERALMRAEESYERSCRDYEKRLHRDQEALNKITDPGQITLGILQHQLLETEYERFRLEKNHELDKQRRETEALSKVVEIPSPCAGTVESIIKQKDGILTDGTQIAMIKEAPRNTLLIVQRAEEHVGRVHFGAGVVCSSDDAVTEGVVVASSFIPELSNSEGDGSGWSIAVLNPDAKTQASIDQGTSPGSLFDSMTYREKVLENVLYIPSAAVSSEVQLDGKEVFYVTVQSEDGSLNKRNVHVLNELADEMWVIAGLEEGEKVVVQERSY